MGAAHSLTAALGVLVVLVFAGCGGSSDGEKLTPPTTAATADTTSEPSGVATTESEEGASSEPNQDPGDFMKVLFERSFRGQHARVWESLHPAHKEVASRSKFVECRNQAEVAGLELEAVEIIEVYDEPVTIPGEAAEMDTKAVTYKITVSVPLLDAPQSITDTSHLIALDNEWTWMLDTTSFEAYGAGTCPDIDE